MGVGKTSVRTALEELGYTVFDSDDVREGFSKEFDDRLKTLRRAQNWDEHNRLYYTSIREYLAAKPVVWDVVFFHGRQGEPSDKFSKSAIVPFEFEEELVFMPHSPIQHIVGVYERELKGRELNREVRQDMYSAIRLMCTNAISNLDEGNEPIEFVYNTGFILSTIIKKLSEMETEKEPYKLRPYGDDTDWNDPEVFKVDEFCSVCGHHLPVDQTTKVGDDYVHSDVRICLALINKSGHRLERME